MQYSLIVKLFLLLLQNEKRMIKQNINGSYLLKLFFLMLLTVVVITKAEQTLTTHAIINSDELAFQNHLVSLDIYFCLVLW